MIITKLLFYISGLVIFWAMIGYPFFIRIIGKLYSGRKLVKDYSLQPTVTVMAVAHNEERIILKKIKNMIELDYPAEKIEFLIVSDCSNDKTNEIVKHFIEQNPDIKIKLHGVKERKGKTNAQNKAQKFVTTEFLVMTDANAMLEKNAVKELMAVFTADDIAYVSGCLLFINKDSTKITTAETLYWKREVKTREIEGRIQTIVAGNGAIYACRTKEYFDFAPIQSHDIVMPLYYALNGKRAICNHDAIAYERTEEALTTEFMRKVRINRSIIKYIIPDIRIFNVFRYKWFSCFYFGHKSCRFLLWIAHLFVLISNILLACQHWFYTVMLCLQAMFFLSAITASLFNINQRYLNLITHYCIAVLAQWVAVIKILTGKSKPFWESNRN